MSSIDFSAVSSQAQAVLDPTYSKDDYLKIDLSAQNERLKEVNAASSEEWEQYITTYLHANKKAVAFGGYLETRNIYKRSTYFKNETNERNIHLGVDLWAPVETSVHAVLDGKIHSFQNNENHGDYGPTIILEHVFQGQSFFTLYGHLSLKSLDNLKVGNSVSAGETIAWLGSSEVNGDYAPHLHFQLILDMEGKQGDYPGVCSNDQLEWYRSNCPDPRLLLKLS